MPKLQRNVLHKILPYFQVMGASIQQCAVPPEENNKEELLLKNTRLRNNSLFQVHSSHTHIQPQCPFC